MSRVGGAVIKIPEGVKVNFANAASSKVVSVSGPVGQMEYNLPESITCSVEGDELKLSIANEVPGAVTFWGTARSICANMVEGVHKGFTKILEINGVGYRAAVNGDKLSLQLGFSHSVDYEIPKGVQIKCNSPTEIEVMGCDKQMVGQVSAHIRGYRPPEPYKGKGVRTRGEFVVRKEGKK